MVRASLLLFPLHVGMPAHVYTMPAARSITYVRDSTYTTYPLS